MNIIYPQILGIVDTLNDWNEKLNSITEGKLDNVLVGSLIVIVLFVVGAWGISALNKK